MSGVFGLIFTLVYDLAVSSIMTDTLIYSFTELGTPCTLVGNDLAIVIGELFSYKAPMYDSLKMVRNFDSN